MTLKEIGKIIVKDDDMYIQVSKEYADALKAIDGFKNLQIVWCFSECDEKCRNILTEKKPYKKGPEVMGVFATRSPNRPNPIAISTVYVTYIDWENLCIHVAYIDAFDGTPVLDIKPYTPSLDRVENPEVPDWCKDWPKSIEESGEFDWSEVFNF